MANGLKGKVIAYTNGTLGTQTIVISGASKFTLWAKSATLAVWTQSQEDAGAVNGQASFKQTLDVDTPFTSDAYSAQANSDFFEDIKIEVPMSAKLHGWIWGQGATWTVLE